MMAIETNGTRHMTVEEFTSAFELAAPGETIVYAIGHLSYAKIGGGGEINGLSKTVMNKQIEGEAIITQKRVFNRPNAWEYRCTKKAAPRVR